MAPCRAKAIACSTGMSRPSRYARSRRPRKLLIRPTCPRACSTIVGNSYVLPDRARRGPEIVLIFKRLQARAWKMQRSNSLQPRDAVRMRSVAGPGLGAVPCCKPSPIEIPSLERLADHAGSRDPSRCGEPTHTLLHTPLGHCAARGPFLLRRRARMSATGSLEE